MRRLVVLLLILFLLSPTYAWADVFVMHDWQNIDWATERPEWPGPVGAWMYWGWDQVASDFDVIDAYLETATGQAKPVAITIMLYEDLGRDSTPASVYASIGRTAGWETIPAGYTYPAWNDAGWDAAYSDLVRRLGARYDRDPRVHSVWIATGLYGETVTTKAGYTIEGHNFGRFVRNSVDWYAAAFPTKPLYLIATGTIDRLALSQYAAERGVGIKQNALAPDLPNHHGLQSVAGLADVYHALPGVPFAYEHFYAPTMAQTYWAMLYGATHGMRDLDLPVAYLDALADTQTLRGALWPQVLAWMGGEEALWVARWTEYDCASRLWECGEEAAWAANAVLLESEGLTLLGRNTEGWLSAPEAVRDTLYGAYGLGLLNGTMTVAMDASGPSRGWLIATGGLTVTVPAGTWRTASDWKLYGWPMAGPETVTISGEGWVHALGSSPSQPLPTAQPSPTIQPSPTAQPPPLIPGDLARSIWIGLAIAVLLALALWALVRLL